MEYKNTLNLPKTAFAMKADLPKREPLMLKHWHDSGLYQSIRQKKSPQGKYILHDGPPYANGDIHIGHALNKTLKDIVIKFKTMQGYDSPYVPGWDCHGLPIEHQLFKELGITKYEIDQVKFRKKAYHYANKFVNKQKEQFARLGVFGDWDNPYLTLNPGYEEAILLSFAKLVEDGFVYRGLKPVNWCYRCETALAEAEVEYEDHTSRSVFVKFELKENSLFDKNSFLLIWTTTPWTLLANVAVAAHPDLAYVCVKTATCNLIIAKSLLGKVCEISGMKEYSILKEVKGKDLFGLAYKHPFIDRIGRVVLADYVSHEEGSGLVHTAPGHGAEDYSTGLKYKLDIIMPVDSKGNFDSTAGQFFGKNIFEANDEIIYKLESLNLLLAKADIRHSYPHCWRCKNPIIFRATNQWFLSLDRYDLRKKLLEVIDSNVAWVPLSGKERISAMVATRPDWCLSRQLYWGVPIPAIICENCKEELLDVQVIENFANLAAKLGSDSWFETDLKEFLPPGLKCSKCNSDKFSKGADILDVWFDSGASSQAVLKKRLELNGVPADLYLEGSDQHRGWFQSSLIPAMCIDKKPPFRGVLTHGFVVDGEGRKMSKSVGNVISPFDIIKDYGADILRMWVASSDYNEDIRISSEILTRLSEAYRKIRNTCRFILSNLYDFNPDLDEVDFADLNKIDRWILFKAEKLLTDTVSAYKSFEFHKAYKGIYDFCNQDLSSLYLDMVKGRLYTHKFNSKSRRSAQSSIYLLLDLITKLAAPILVFTSDEIWQAMPKRKQESESLSIHLLDCPESIIPQTSLSEAQKEFSLLDENIIPLIPVIAKALEEKRSAQLIGSSFDAKIKLLTNNQNRYKYLETFKGELCEIFKVSQIELSNSCTSELEISVSKAEGNKCVRCWNYSDQTGLDSSYPDICPTCINAIKKDGA